MDIVIWMVCQLKLPNENSIISLKKQSVTVAIPTLFLQAFLLIMSILLNNYYNHMDDLRINEGFMCSEVLILIGILIRYFIRLDNTSSSNRGDYGKDNYGYSF
ncbi:hypothetical protein H8356DRAFT_1421033 [Neocallimastix lanati (nom. inval.)]|nr:hypothetical protein H8356DRAFT_1421033 [Neocallimastix sp. JGI-2020a]